MDFVTYRTKLLHGDFSDLAPYSGSLEGWLVEKALDEEALSEALTCAAFNGQTDVVNILLASGVDPDGGAATGMTALHWSANRGHLETVRALVDAGADLERLNNYGGTVLGCTVWSALNEPHAGQREVVRYLVEVGADRSQADFPTGDAELDKLLAT